MKNPNGPSIEDIEEMKDEIQHPINPQCNPEACDHEQAQKKRTTISPAHSSTVIGKYDAITQAVLDTTGAQAVVVVVVEGHVGTGCGIKARDREILLRLTTVLETMIPKMVEEIRKDAEAHGAIRQGGRG